VSHNRRSVVITGLGPITAAGIGVDALRAGLRAERSPIATVTRFDPSPFRSTMAAEVRDFDPTRFMSERLVRRTDRFVQMSVASTALALADAGLLDGDGALPDREGPPHDGAGPELGRVADLDPERTAIQMGSAMGGLAHGETQLRVFIERGARRLDPRLATTTFAGAASCQVAVQLGITGPNSTNAMSCAAGAMAIGEATRLIREGIVDAALAGGVDAPLAPLCYGAFSSLRAMSSRNDRPEASCRPFDAGRDGFVMGEGACIMVLESRERADARGARIYAEVAGYGTNIDAYHMAAPREDGRMATTAMRVALAGSGLPPGEVDHVNAHASSTPLNDPVESSVIRGALGASADDVSVTGTKPFHGHALGAAGAIEAGIVCLSIADGWVPATLNLERPAEGCDLDYVRAGGRAAPVEVALSNSFGFGGINAVLCLTAPHVSR